MITMVTGEAVIVQDVWLLATPMSVADINVMKKSARILNAGEKGTIHHTVNMNSYIGRRTLTVGNGKWIL